MTAPAPVAADVGIVAALGVEVGFLSDRLKKVRRYSGPHHRVIEGEIDGRLVVLIVGGMGRDAARRSAALLIDGHRPRWIISAGFAGALDPSLKRDEVVLPSEIVDPHTPPIAVEALDLTDDGTGVFGLGFRRGRLLTVDAIVRTAVEKELLRARFGADLLDMETSAVAQVCHERSVRFLSVRVISDEATTDLPKEVVTLMTRSGSYLIGSAVRAVWRRPSALKDFWALHEHAQSAADRLAEATLAVIARLPI